ncbi:MAG: hypothetical protein R3B93_01590 [Bacteroidia bacterium]
MTKLKERIIQEIKTLNSPQILGQVFDFLRLIRSNSSKPRNNGKDVLALAGTLDTKDAREMENIINQEFNSIEGEW